MNRLLTVGAIAASLTWSSCVAEPIDEMIPKDFDPGSTYKPYSYDDLYAHVKKSRGISNAFFGEQVKIFAKLNAHPWGNINPNLWHDPTVSKRSEVQDKLFFFPSRPEAICGVCDRTIRVMDASTDSVSGVYGTALSSFEIYLVLPTQKAFIEFRKAMFEKCMPTEKHPGIAICYVAAAGRLRTEDANFTKSVRPFGPGEGPTQLVVLDATKFSLYANDSPFLTEMRDAATSSISRVKPLLEIVKSIPH